MAVPAQQTIFNYVASGGTTFGFSCRVLEDADLVVTVDGVVQGEGVAYSLSGIGAEEGGTVIFNVAPTVGAEVRIYRQTQVTRSTDYQIGGDFLAPVVNADIDRVYMAMQDLQKGSTEVLNSLRVPAGEALNVLPSAEARAAKLLAFDSLGQPAALVGIDAGSATALDLSLRDGLVNTSGAGQVGWTRGLGYPAGSVGAKLEQLVSIRDFGALPGNSDSTNKAALQAAISALATVGGQIVVPEDISTGHVASNKTTWPSFAGVTKPLTILDRGYGKSYAGYPTAYDGAQMRVWFFTPQTTSPGQHDGNTFWVRGAWAPNFIVSNDMDLSGARAAGDNRRAYFATAVNGLATWAIGSGTLAGSTQTDEVLSNFTITKYGTLPSDTLGDYAPLVIERKTGNMSYGSSTNVPVAHHQFGRVPTSPTLALAALVSDNTTADLLLRDSVGVANDVVVKNVSGDFIVRLVAVGDAIQVKKTTRRVQITQALVLAKVNLAYSASMTINSDAGNIFQIFASNATAFTINAPTGTLSDGQEITVRISNVSGGALGAVTWSAAFKMSAWTQPANGFGRSISFYYDAATPAWIQKGGASIDVPN